MKKILDSNFLKFIAIIAMTIDHITWASVPGFPVAPLPIILHLMGRITCPIMCFFIAEGYHYTRDINKYTARLFLFAVISHFAYIFAGFSYSGHMSFVPFSNGEILNQTGVIWSLAWGLVMLRIIDSSRIKYLPVKIILIILICFVTLPADWSCIASLLVLSFGTNRDNDVAKFAWMIGYVGLYSAVYFFEVDKVYGILQMGVVLSIPLLLMYNGKRSGSKNFNTFMKWGFYIYYPLHLFIIGFFRNFF